MKFAQKDEYEKAIFNIRRAINKDRDNLSYVLDFAGLLTEIEHFDDSNDLLFSVLRKSGDFSAECYFGLGCNFYGLNDFKKATSSLNKYLSISPDGEYAEDAEVMLENINFDSMLADSPETDLKLNESLTEGDTKSAIEMLKKISGDGHEHSLLLRNNLAVAYILENDIEKAEKVCAEILQEDPFNIHALCNMSMAKHRMGDEEAAKTYVLTALDQDEYDYGELLKISIALCDLSMHEDASDVFYELLSEDPYDLHSRHFLAIALFNCGDYDNALKNFKFISMFKPDDSVNNWYIKTVNQRIAGKTNIDYFPYVNQVSSECVYSRINKINEILKDKTLDNPWKSAEFRELVLWAFDIKDDTLKSSMITLIAKYAGDEAASILKSKLCSRHVSDDIKHKILMSLKKLGEKEPYIALMDDNIVEVSVNTFEVNATRHLEMQRDIVELILANMPESYDIEYFKYIINTWNIIVAKDSIFDTISDSRLWAAALEYNYDRKIKSDSDPQISSIRYNVDINEMLNLANIINELTGEN